MNRDETNVFGTIVVVTSIGLAGWFEVSHDLGQQTVNAENDETPASEPAPASNSTRARKNTSGAENRGTTMKLAAAGDVVSAEKSVADQAGALSTEGLADPAAETEARSESPTATAGTRRHPPSGVPQAP